MSVTCWACERRKAVAKVGRKTEEADDEARFPRSTPHPDSEQSSSFVTEDVTDLVEAVIARHDTLVPTSTRCQRPDDRRSRRNR